MSKETNNKTWSGEVFRRATLDDFEAVKNISDSLYNGLDYMNDNFPHIIQHPLFYGVVAEINGNVVAFLGGYVQNNNTRLITKGGRVVERCRGQGVYKRLLTFLLTEMKSRFPCLMTRQFFSGTTNLAIKKLLTNKAYTVLFRQGICSFKQPKMFLQKPAIACTQLDRESFKILLSKKKTQSEIFPHKMFVKWEMCDPDVDELDFFYSHQPFIFHSDHAGLSVVTIGGLIRSTRGLVYVIQCHAPTSADFSALEQSLQVHVTSHVTLNAYELTDESPFVMVIPENNIDVLKQAALKQGFTQLPFFTATFIVFSQEI